jgi:hypothetical protein
LPFPLPLPFTAERAALPFPFPFPSIMAANDAASNLAASILIGHGAGVIQ